MKENERVDISDMSTTEILSTVYELKEISEYLDDPQLDRALEILIKALYGKGELSPAAAPRTIVELQALSSKFGILATYYQTIGKKGDPDATTKKNLYYTLRDSFAKLADSVKYLAR